MHKHMLSSAGAASPQTNPPTMTQDEFEKLVSEKLAVPHSEIFGNYEVLLSTLLVLHANIHTAQNDIFILFTNGSGEVITHEGKQVVDFILRLNIPEAEQFTAAYKVKYPGLIIKTLKLSDENPICHRIDMDLSIFCKQVLPALKELGQQLVARIPERVMENARAVDVKAAPPKPANANDLTARAEGYAPAAGAGAGAGIPAATADKSSRQVVPVAARPGVDMKASIPGGGGSNATRALMASSGMHDPALLEAQRYRNAVVTHEHGYNWAVKQVMALAGNKPADKAQSDDNPRYDMFQLSPMYQAALICTQNLEYVIRRRDYPAVKILCEKYGVLVTQQHWHMAVSTDSRLEVAIYLYNRLPREQRNAQAKGEVLLYAEESSTPLKYNVLNGNVYLVHYLYHLTNHTDENIQEAIAAGSLQMHDLSKVNLATLAKRSVPGASVSCRSSQNECYPAYLKLDPEFAKFAYQLEQVGVGCIIPGTRPSPVTQIDIVKLEQILIQLESPIIHSSNKKTLFQGLLVFVVLRLQEALLSDKPELRAKTSELLRIQSCSLYLLQLNAAQYIALADAMIDIPTADYKQLAATVRKYVELAFVLGMPLQNQPTFLNGLQVLQKLDAMLHAKAAGNAVQVERLEIQAFILLGKLAQSQNSATALDMLKTQVKEVKNTALQIIVKFFNRGDSRVFNIKNCALLLADGANDATALSKLGASNAHRRALLNEIKQWPEPLRSDNLRQILVQDSNWQRLFATPPVKTSMFELNFNSQDVIDEIRKLLPAPARAPQVVADEAQIEAVDHNAAYAPVSSMGSLNNG